MIFRTILVSVVLSTLVLAQTKGPHPGHEDHKGHHHEGGRNHTGGHRGSRHHGKHGAPPMAFLQNATKEVQDEFFKLLNDNSSTISQIESNLSAWAAKNKIADSYKEYVEKTEAHRAEADKKTAKVVGNLAEVQKKIEAIHADKSQTNQAKKDALAKLREQHPAEVNTLEYITHVSAKGNGKRHHRGGKKGHGKHGKRDGDKKDHEKKEEAKKA